MRNTFWKSGDYSAICDICGFKFKASDLRERWDGHRVCDQDWEIRHPQEMVRPIPDQRALPWTRPESTDVYIPRTNRSSFTIAAAALTATITDSNITASKNIIVTGWIPNDPTAIIGKITSGSGTASVTMAKAPTNALTVYYNVVPLGTGGQVYG